VRLANRRTHPHDNFAHVKGEEMKKQDLKLALGLVGLLGMSTVVHAEVRDEIKVTIPFRFVAGGKNLPPGIYKVSRFSDDKHEGLILSSYDNHVSVIVYPTTVSDAAADTPSVSFSHVGATQLLSRIETAYDIYNIRISPVGHDHLPELK
jgi:hypothetical protein